MTSRAWRLAAVTPPITADNWAGAVLVDSSVWIDHFQNRPTPAAQVLADWLGDEPERIVVNGVVACKLLRGMPGEAAAAALQQALDRLTQADDIRRADWLASAGIYRECRAAGLTIRSALDCLIAAHAIRLDLPLLASDRDFPSIASRSALAVFQPKEAS